MSQKNLMITFENDDMAGISMEMTADTTYGSGDGDQLSEINCTCCRRCLHRSRLNTERLKHSLCEIRVKNGWLLDRQRDLEMENRRLTKTWCETEAVIRKSEASHLRESRASLREFESKLRELEAKDVAAEYTKARLIAMLYESDIENHRLRAELTELIDQHKQQDAEWSESVDLQKCQDAKLSDRMTEHRAILSTTIGELKAALSSCVGLQAMANRLTILQTDLSASGVGDDR